MKTVLYSSIYLDGPDAGGTMLQRVMKFVYFYQNQQVIKYDEMYFIDNGSSRDMLSFIPPEVVVESFRHLNRGPNLDHPYAWRGHWNIINLFDLGFEKVVQIEPDYFVLTPKLADFINSVDSGWHAFWCPKYGFPENGVHIICKDMFDTYRKFIGPTLADAMKYNNTNMPCESRMPYTHIHKEFNCDRWGEACIPQSPDMDMYGQCPVDIRMTFNLTNHPDL